MRRIAAALIVAAAVLVPFAAPASAEAVAAAVGDPGGSRTLVVEDLDGNVKTVAGTASRGLGWKLPALIVLSVVSIVGAVAAWARPRTPKDENELSDELLGDQEEEEEEEDMEHTRQAIDVDDPGVVRLYEAMYGPAPAPPIRPKLTVVANGDGPVEAKRPEVSEEFAWTVTSRR